MNKSCFCVIAGGLLPQIANAVSNNASSSPNTKNKTTKVAHFGSVLNGLPMVNGVSESPGIQSVTGDGVWTNGTGKLAENGASARKSHPLYGHGVCKWPGCDTPADTYDDFLK